MLQAITVLHIIISRKARYNYAALMDVPTKSKQEEYAEDTGHDSNTCLPAANATSPTSVLRKSLAISPPALLGKRKAASSPSPASRKSRVMSERDEIVCRSKVHL